MLKFGISFTVEVSALAAVVACVACTDSADLGGGAGTAQDSGQDVATGSSGSSGGQDGSLIGDSSDPRNDDGGACGTLTHHDGLIGPGGTLAERPVGSSLRIRFAYQGARIAITRLTATDSNPGRSFGPLEAGKNSGYWYELRNAGDVTLDTRTILDPTNQEAFGGDGGFMNSTIPVCREKTFEVQSSNDGAAKFMVIFGSPYGTQNAAGELARFVIP